MITTESELRRENRELIEERDMLQLRQENRELKRQIERLKKEKQSTRTSIEYEGSNLSFPIRVCYWIAGILSVATIVLLVVTA